ncbi:MAG: DUF2225 domain-containing protein [Holophaga sp.]|nr:DUF2225 domain-containing protein [Holophaga sp.]
MAEEPLLSKLIQCPACERKVPLRIANPRLYTVASRESDRHVTGYRWVHGILTDVLPHHYRVWQCPECLFADLAENVDRDTPDPFAEAVREAFQDISIEKHMVLESLRKLVPGEELDPKGAIAIHLAALLITTLPPPGRQVDHSKLGQLALRLAWLFRELDGPIAQAATPTASEALTGLAESTERLDRLLAEAGTLLREIRQHGERRTEELRQANPEANPYFPLGDMIEVRLQTLQSEVTTLQLAVLQDQQGGLAPAELPAQGQETAGSLVKALLAITPLWPALPRSERQGLRLALESFEYSYQFEEVGESVENGVAQVSLILDILIRLGELERALEWTSQISKYAGDTSADLKSRQNQAKANKTLTSFDATVISRKIAALNLSHQKAGERRRDILALMLERDRAKIDAVLAETAQLPVAERMKALAKLGLHDSVLAMVSRELAEPAKEGSGWIKGLFRAK